MMQNFYLFQFFNNAGFAIMTGMPMLLYVQNQKVSATIYAILLATQPLTTLLQLPAARWIERIGYKKMLTLGWLLRVIVCAAVGGVILCPSEWISHDVRVGVVLALVAVFCAIRNVAYCSYMPWAMRLLPEDKQGKFVSMDFMLMNASNLATLIFAAIYLKYADSLQDYALLFFIAALFSTISRWFIHRMPHAPTDQEYRSNEPVPWLAMFQHPPFQRILLFQVLLMITWSGGGLCYIPFMRDRFHVEDTVIAWYMALWSSIFVAMCPMVYRWMEKFGCKPLLRVAGILQIGHFITWCGLNAYVIPFNYASVIFGQIIWGLSFPFMLIATMRLLIRSIPEKGRSHFLAIFTVISSLTAGLSPFVWGSLVDHFQNWHVPTVWFDWNVHSTAYLLVALFFTTALITLRFVPEPKAKKAEEFLLHLLMRTPARFFVRLMATKP